MIGWGIGPRFGVTCIAYVGTAALLTRRFPEDLTFSRVLYIALATAGMLLIAVGLGAYLLTLMLLLVGQRKGKLVTTGAYRIVRHPLYATWLWLILPGIALLGRSWFMLGVVPIGYAIFKAFINMTIGLDKETPYVVVL